MQAIPKDQKCVCFYSNMCYQRKLVTYLMNNGVEELTLARLAAIVKVTMGIVDERTVDKHFAYLRSLGLVSVTHLGKSFARNNATVRWRRAKVHGERIRKLLMEGQ